MRILLTGRHGQVGWELHRALQPLGEIVATARAELDLADADAIRSLVRATRPKLIVNAAAYTAVDRAESEPELAMQINGVAPGVLADEARQVDALLVHYSTDYIFDGEKRAPYTESDAASPLNTYGRTKLEGEKRIDAAGCKALVLRTSWVYAPRGKNFFLTIAGKLKAGTPLRVVDDQRGAPTEARFVAETTVALLRGGAQGVFHAVPSGATTWHGFAAEIARRIGSDVPVRAIASSEYPTPARRPRNSVLDCTKLSLQLGRAAPDWRVLLERCLAEWRPQ